MADDRKQLIAQADRALQRGDMGEAASLYRKLLASTPSDLVILQRLGDTLARSGQEVEARDVFRQIADQYWNGGHRARSMAALRRATRLGPPDRALLGLLGQRLIEQGLAADARDPLLEAAKLAEQAEDRGNAVALYGKVAEMLPRDYVCREGLVRVADRSRIAGDRVTTRVGLAVARLRGGDAATAFRLVGEALEVDPSHTAFFPELPALVSAAQEAGLDAVPESPGSLTEDGAAAWTVVRQVLLSRLGLLGASNVPLEAILERPGTSARVRLHAARLLIERNELGRASEVLVGLEAAADDSLLLRELLDTASSLVARHPGNQPVADLLARLSTGQRDARVARVGNSATPPAGSPWPQSRRSIKVAPDPAVPLPAPEPTSHVAPPPPPPAASAAPRHAERADDRGQRPEAVPLPAEAQAKLLEARAFQRQGLVEQARWALAAITAPASAHPAVAALRAELERPAPRPAPVPPKPAPRPAAAAEDDDMFVILDTGDLEGTGDERPVTAPTPAAAPARPAAAAPPPAPVRPAPPAPAANTHRTAPQAVVARKPAGPATTGEMRAQSRTADGVDLGQLEHLINRVVEPGDAEMGYQMALGLVEMGLGEQAIPLLEQALGDPSRRVDAVVLLTRVRVPRGQAERAYQEALAVHYGSEGLAPSMQAELFSLLTDLALLTSRPADARVFLAELTRIYPAHPGLAKLKTRLAKVAP